jgi:Domain of unknown function (DUF4397)
MKHLSASVRRALICAPLIALSACGGGGSDDNADDRLDIADPVVRFVHASPLAPSVTLFRDEVPQASATNVGYKFASDYFDVQNSLATWSVKTAGSPAVTVGTEPIDATRGNKYTIVALPSSNTENSIYVIRDPYNKSLTSDKAKLRIMNASFNASSIDLYVNAVGTDIAPAAVVPTIAATAYKTSGPATGNDSYDLSGGSYQLTITRAGGKTVLFRGNLVIQNNKDVLLLTVPDNILPGQIKTLVKIEGTPGTAEIAPI